MHNKEAYIKLVFYKNLNYCYKLSEVSGSVMNKVSTHHKKIVKYNRNYLKCIFGSFLICTSKSKREHRKRGLFK